MSAILRQRGVLSNNHERLNQGNRNDSIQQPDPFVMDDNSLMWSSNASIQLAPEEEQPLPDLQINVSIIAKKVDNQQVQDERGSQEDEDGQEDSSIKLIDIANRVDKNEE